MPKPYVPVSGFDSPGMAHGALAKSDTVDLVLPPRAIYCAAEGTASIVDTNGATLSYALAAGQILPFAAKRINATGTTAVLYGWW